jgi:hypothetical protein
VAHHTCEAANLTETPPKKVPPYPSRSGRLVVAPLRRDHLLERSGVIHTSPQILTEPATHPPTQPATSQPLTPSDERDDLPEPNLSPDPTNSAELPHGNEDAAGGTPTPKTADKQGNIAEPEQQDMPSPHVTNPARRFVLPTLCASLAVASSLWGEYVLVEQAGHPTLGPLLAAQVAVLISAAFIALAIITLLLAIFPGKEHVEDDSPDESHPAVALVGQDESEETGPQNEDDPAPSPAPVVSRGRSADDIIAALKKSATKQATARLAAEKRAEDAVARAQELEEQIAAFRDGTAPEVKAMKARYREESNRDAMRKVHELGEASDRLAQVLKDGKARVEEELAAREAELRDLRDSIPSIRHGIAVDEHRRLRIALEAINDNPEAELNERQRAAVTHHVARLDEAMKSLDPEAGLAFSPEELSLPPLTDPVVSKSLSDDQPTIGKKRGSLFARKSRKGKSND